jgi:hypothetical protein
MAEFVSMKQVRASESDMEAAAIIAGMLSDVAGGDYPRLPNGGQLPDDPGYFDPDNFDHLRAFFDRVSSCLDDHPGSLGRVVWGFHTLMHSNLVDPSQDYLAIHPRIMRALESYGVQGGQEAH